MTAQNVALGAMSGVTGETFRVGMVVFDGMTLLDTVGPADMFARVPGLEVIMISRSREPITTDAGIRLLPDTTLAEAPSLDLLFVGGGPGTTYLLDDEEIVDFVRTRGETAKWVTSVCTGALVLGAAGLLQDYKAATHWAVMHLLPILGAEPVEQRVVIDRNRITGGGVTAGIDFALTIIAEIWGNDLAQLIQLGSEYDPQPPFRTGSPRTAPPELVTRFEMVSAELTEARRLGAMRAAARLRA
jgi:cyclohexyl-isocyanide hydratase